MSLYVHRFAERRADTATEDGPHRQLYKKTPRCESALRREGKPPEGQTEVLQRQTDTSGGGTISGPSRSTCTRLGTDLSLSLSGCPLRACEPLSRLRSSPAFMGWRAFWQRLGDAGQAGCPVRRRRRRKWRRRRRRGLHTRLYRERGPEGTLQVRKREERTRKAEREKRESKRKREEEEED